MQMSPYLSFNGQCEAAFSFYELSLGGTLGPLFRYAGSPASGQVSADWSDKIMHGSITIGGQLLQGADVAPEQYEQPKGFSLSLQMTSVEEGERVFRDLAAGGRVVMPFEATFWAAGFGMVVDRFGIPWLVNCEAPAA
jgi:PhnB protein